MSRGLKSFRWQRSFSPLGGLCGAARKARRLSRATWRVALDLEVVVAAGLVVVEVDAATSDASLEVLAAAVVVAGISPASASLDLKVIALRVVVERVERTREVVASRVVVNVDSIPDLAAEVVIAAGLVVVDRARVLPAGSASNHVSSSPSSTMFHTARVGI